MNYQFEKLSPLIVENLIIIFIKTLYFINLY